jgi:hypothetical protein
MIAGHSPRLIFSHNYRLLKPTLPKYIPFTRVDNFLVLKFDISACDSIPPHPTSTVTQCPSSSETILSLEASSYPSRPSAGLSFELNHQPSSFPRPSACGTLVATGPGPHASVSWPSDVVSKSSMAVALPVYGGADAQVEVTVGVGVAPVTGPGCILVDDHQP